MVDNYKFECLHNKYACCTITCACHRTSCFVLKTLFSKEEQQENVRDSQHFSVTTVKTDFFLHCGKICFQMSTFLALNKPSKKIREQKLRDIRTQISRPFKQQISKPCKCFRLLSYTALRGTLYMAFTRTLSIITKTFFLSPSDVSVTSSARETYSF